MKKQLFNLRALLMLCMFFVIGGGGSVAFAEEVTVTSTFTDNKWAVNTGEPTWTASANGAAIDNNEERGIQFGKNKGTLTLTSKDAFTSVTKVVIVASANGTSGKLSVKVGSSTVGSTLIIANGVINKNQDYSFVTETGIDGTVTITATEGNHSIWIKSISITYSTGSTTTATLTGISVSGDAADLWKGDDFTHEGITVTATYDDASTADVTSFCTYSGCDMSTAGSRTVTVSYGGKEATYTVNVKTIGNTQENAYTASEAIALIDAGKDLKTPVYVKGKVSEIVTAFSSQYGNISFNVSENGTTEGAQFLFYRNFKGANNVKYNSENECPKVGDKVIGYGKLTKYNTTYEFSEGNYLVEKTVSTAPSSKLTLSQNTGKVNVDKTLDISGYVSTADDYTGTVTYAVTEGTEYASVSKDGVITGLAVGTATIKVTAPAIVGSFSESSADFSVNVVDNRTATTVTFGPKVDNQTFDVNLGEKFEGKTATVTPAEAGNVTYKSDNTDVASVDENGAITLGRKEGTATITASFAATDNYQASSAKYYITVTDPNVPVFKKVASNDDIIDGEQYLIICEGKNKAMSSYNSSKYYNVVDVTITDNSYEGKVNAEGLPYTVTVHKSATDGYYTLETAEGYVKSTTSDNTSIFNSEMTSEEDVFLWKLDVTDSNSPIYSKYVPARFIAYNPKNPRIALYKSTSADRALVSLYKKVGSKPAEPAYGELTFKAQDKMYYATFSSDKDVVFTKDVIVSAVSVAYNKLSIKDLDTGYYEVTDATVGEGTGIVEKGFYVPKNNGVLISCTDVSAKYYFPKTEETTVTLPTNQLKAAPAEGGKFTGETGYKYYKLAYNDYNAKKGLGFYWGAEYGGAFSVKAGTAYLAVPSTSETNNVKGFSFDGTTTGIDATDAVEAEKIREIYTIAGQKVSTMSKPGLYIVNGKKTVIRK